MDDIQNRVEVIRISVFEITANIFNYILWKIPCKAPLIIWFVSVLAAAKAPCEYFDQTIEFLSALLKCIWVIEQ